jgi:hypothetical protein
VPAILESEQCSSHSHIVATLVQFQMIVELIVRRHEGDRRSIRAGDTSQAHVGVCESGTAVGVEVGVEATLRAVFLSI